MRICLFKISSFLIYEYIFHIFVECDFNDSYSTFFHDDIFIGYADEPQKLFGGKNVVNLNWRSIIIIYYGHRHPQSTDHTVLDHRKAVETKK